MRFQKKSLRLASHYVKLNWLTSVLERRIRSRGGLIASGYNVRVLGHHFFVLGPASRVIEIQRKLFANSRCDNGHPRQGTRVCFSSYACLLWLMIDQHDHLSADFWWAPMPTRYCTPWNLSQSFNITNVTRTLACSMPWFIPCLLWTQCLLWPLAHASIWFVIN